MLYVCQSISVLVPAPSLYGRVMEHIYEQRQCRMEEVGVDGGCLNCRTHGPSIFHLCLGLDKDLLS